MAVRSVSVTRTLITPDPGPLLIGPGHAGTFTVAGDGVFRPDVVWSRGFAPKHPHVDGEPLLSASKDNGTHPLDVQVRAATRALLTTAQDELEATFGQFTFQATFDTDGVTRTWQCLIADVVWGRTKVLDHHLIAVASLNIPIKPNKVA